MTKQESSEQKLSQPYVEHLCESYDVKVFRTTSEIKVIRGSTLSLAETHHS